MSVADAKTLMPTPTETIAALKAYFLQLSRLKTKNTQPYTPTESTDACSPTSLIYRILAMRPCMKSFANTRHLVLHSTVISRV